LSQEFDWFANFDLKLPNDFLAWYSFNEIVHSGASARKETDRAARRSSVAVELLEAAKKGKRPPFFSS
jgi:hypothetical protein